MSGTVVDYKPGEYEDKVRLRLASGKSTTVFVCKGWWELEQLELFDLGGTHDSD